MTGKAAVNILMKEAVLIATAESLSISTLFVTFSKTVCDAWKTELKMFKTDAIHAASVVSTLKRRY